MWVNDNSPLIENHPKQAVQNSCLHVSFWLNVTESLCFDLYSGLHGQSGAITRNMYLLYIQTVDQCVNILSSSDDFELIQRNSVLTMEYTQMCQAAIFSLWNICCEFPLKQASLLKLTMTLCIDKLPSLIRRIVRVHLFAPSVHAKEQINLNLMKQAPNAVALEQCFDLLKCQHEAKARGEANVVWHGSKASSSEGDKIAPDKILTNEGNSLVEINGENKSCSEDRVDSSRSSPQKIIAVERSCNNLNPLKRKILLSSPELWSTAYNCFLLSSERCWMESCQIVRLGLARKSKCNEQEKENILLRSQYSSEEIKKNISQYAVDRTDELHSILSSVLAYLGTFHSKESSEREIDDKSKSKSSQKQTKQPIFAELLSPSARIRLCSCLERISITLKSSLRCVMGRLKLYQMTKTADDFAVDYNHIIFGDEALTESLSCLAAWLRQNPKASHSALNLTSEIKLWYDAEKMRSTNMNKSKDEHNSEDDPVLSRLPKLVFRSEELEAGLQKLYNIVTTENDDSKGKLSEPFLTALDKFIGEMLFDCKDRGKSEGSGGVLSYMLLRSINSFRPSRARNFATLDKPDEDSSSATGSISERNFARRKKRKWRDSALEHQLRKARRRMVRSRNSVVNEWLTLDEEHEKPRNSDAFVDLEDFLVEG